ncbi:MAG: YitT family protein [Clostridia bacterium]|nr:YitT family protein [Clostridia bacterium]
MKFEKKEAWNQVRNVFLVIVGTLILAFGTAVFILPFDLVAGGMSGFAIVIDALIPIEWITVDMIIAVLTWSLFLIGFLLFGKGFAAKTLISAIVYPIGITLFLKLTEPSVLGGLFCLQASEYTELPLIISATVGGALIGVGCAVTFLSGGSTGGIDIIAFVLCKIFKRLKSSTAIFFIDVFIILLGVFLTQNLILSLLGIVSAMISAIVIDKIFLGGSAAFVAQIVTEKGEEINRAVIERMERSTTIFEATGGYSKKHKQMLTVSFSMQQYTRLMDIVRRADPAAFVTVWRAHEIRGEGWNETK